MRPLTSQVKHNDHHIIRYKNTWIQKEWITKSQLFNQDFHNSMEFKLHKN